MGRILIDSKEVEVSEDAEDILAHVVRAKDGLRLGNGVIVAPSGWARLTAPATGEPIYVQVARIAYVCDE